MKTTVYIITTFLTLSFNSLYASGTELPARYVSATELAPAVPVEATFEETVPDQDYLYAVMLKILAPETPSEADFTDEGTGIDNIMSTLHPYTPDEAEFNDSI